MLLLLAISALMLCIIFIVSITDKKENFTKNERPTINTIWSYWEPFPPPEIIRKCIKNWDSVGKCKDIRILNDKSLKEYIPQTEIDIITKKSTSAANKSDFIGLYLIATYGGTWMDASIFLHKPLFSWLPIGEFFCYRADRFSKDTICMEMFFIHSPKGHPIAVHWYESLKKEADDIKGFIKRNKQKYPLFADGMGGNTEYLWPYLVGKIMLLENGDFKSLLTTKSAEKGPYIETVKNNWDPIKTCSILEKEQCKDCNMTKLFNGTRKACKAEIIKQ